MRLPLTRSLTDRPFSPGEVWTYLSRELVPAVKELLRAMTASPLVPVSTGASLTLDLRTCRDYGVVLDQDTILDFVNAIDGAEGLVVVQQDAVGGHLLTVTASGRTVLRQDPATDDNPAAGPSAVTRYRYFVATLPSGPYLILERLILK